MPGKIDSSSLLKDNILPSGARYLKTELRMSPFGGSLANYSKTPMIIFWLITIGNFNIFF